MQEHLEKYKMKLQKAICEYMSAPVTERSSNAVHSMLECMEEVNQFLGNKDHAEHHQEMSKEDYVSWNKNMVNDDNTHGGHWDEEQTDAYKPGEFYPCMWNTAMNMMYSDYCEVAEKYGVGTPEYYADMAKAFLHDKDGGKPEQKMSEYYHNIVKKA